MITKSLEIRDRMTFIAVMAIKMKPANEGQRYLSARSGFGTSPWDQSKYVIIMRLDGLETKLDAYDWSGGARTMKIAHNFIAQNFDDLDDGDVVDVEFILGETDKMKASEARLAEIEEERYWKHRTNADEEAAFDAAAEMDHDDETDEENEDEI